MWDQGHLFEHREPVCSSVLAGRDVTVTPRGSGVVTSSKNCKQRFEWMRTFTLDFKSVWARMTVLFVATEAHLSVNLWKPFQTIFKKLIIILFILPNEGQSETQEPNKAICFRPQTLWPQIIPQLWFQHLFESNLILRLSYTSPTLYNINM